MRKSLVQLDPKISLENAQQVLEKAGAKKAIASHTAQGLWETSLRGVDSHGLRLLPHYVLGLEKGRIAGNVNFTFCQNTISTGTLDAKHSFGHAAGRSAMKHAIQIADKTGVGIISVKNSSHCGALAYFAQQACSEDMIGFAFTHATPKVQTYNAKTMFFGTNPLCFAAPMETEGPYCFDAAPTKITFNKVRQHRDLDTTLPEGAASDDEGIPTNDPFKAAQLLPIGSYKGFGFTMMVDILCSLLTGMPGGTEVSDMFGGDMAEHRYLGHLFMAIKIDSFTPVQTFKSRLQKTVEKIRLQPALNNNQKVMVAGDPEKLQWNMRLNEGIPIPLKVYETLNQICSKYNLRKFKTIQ